MFETHFHPPASPAVHRRRRLRHALAATIRGGTGPVGGLNASAGKRFAAVLHRLPHRCEAADGPAQ